MSDDQRVIIFDTTLRDGEQSPGASMNTAEKLEIARALEQLGVDVIEAGFPIASPDDFNAVHAIAEQSTRASICGLARSLPKDIEAAGRAVQPAGDRGRIHVFLATSAIHRQHKLNKAKEEIIRMAVEAVQMARQHVADVEFSPEDASRTEPEFLAEVVEAVIAAGASTVNIPDTVGYAYPDDYAGLITYLREHVSNIEQAVISVHCHNDLGLAVANSLAAVQAGARQIECTINGIGERAGNCALEEVVMAMRVRKDIFGSYATGIRTEGIYHASRLVQTVTGLQIQRNKAVVGENAFAHESGIHQDGVLKHAETYEIMTPASVGVPAQDMVLGKHSGRAAIADRLAKIGFVLDKDQVGEVFLAFKELADKKKVIYDGDLMVLVEEVVRGNVVSAWTLDYLHTSSATGGPSTATVTLSRDGASTTDAATGDGPVDAAITALDRICQTQGELKDYQLRSISQGRDAQGEVSLSAVVDGIHVGGKAVDTDVVRASVEAYLDAINRAIIERTVTREADDLAQP